MKRGGRKSVAIIRSPTYNSNVNIRYATPADAKLLAELAAKTFFDTFAKDNSKEDMCMHLEQSYSPEIQLEEISTPDTIFLTAEVDDAPVGYAQLILDSREDLIQGSKPLEVRRIYALQEFIGKGIGKALMQACITEARSRGCDCVWLGVWEKNPRAIEFYKKWGFKEIGTHTFNLGNDLQKDYIMELELSQE